MRSVPRTRSSVRLRGSTRASLSEARRARGFLRSSRGGAARPSTAHFATPAGKGKRAAHERGIDGALVRVSLPLAASAAFAESAVGLESFAALVVDVASGIARVHLVNDDDAVIRDAEALLLAARMVAGAGRIERRAEHLRSRLLTWPNRPNGDFLMRRIKDAFDPAGILEPGRSAFA